VELLHHIRPTAITVVHVLCAMHKNNSFLKKTNTGSERK
jgi:hypothetical protein